MKQILPLVILALSIAASAQAPDVQTAFANFGLLGNWAQDCQVKPSTTDAHLSITARRTQGYFLYNFGSPVLNATWTYTSAELIDATHLRLLGTTKNWHIVEQIIFMNNGRIQLVSEIDTVNEAVTVKDGVQFPDNPN